MIIVGAHPINTTLLNYKSQVIHSTQIRSSSVSYSVPMLYGSGSQRMPVGPAVLALSQNLIEMPTVCTSELLNQKYGFDNQQSVFTIPRDDSDTLLKFKSLGQ